MELSGLELRRKYWELRGYEVTLHSYENSPMPWYQVKNVEGHRIDSGGCADEYIAWQNTPAVESDPAVSEAELEKVCKGNRWRYEEGWSGLDGVDRWTDIYCRGNGHVEGIGNSLSEARARALCRALEER